MAYKVKNLESLKKSDPKLYAILKAADTAASVGTTSEPATTSVPPTAPTKTTTPSRPQPTASKARADRQARIKELRAKKKHRPSQRNEQRSREWVESPDVASMFWKVVRTALYTITTLWILIAANPQSSDGWIVVGFYLVVANLLAAIAGWLLTAVFSNMVERILPTGGGRWEYLDVPNTRPGAYENQRIEEPSTEFSKRQKFVAMTPEERGEKIVELLTEFVGQQKAQAAYTLGAAEARAAAAERALVTEREGIMGTGIKPGHIVAAGLGFVAGKSSK